MQDQEEHVPGIDCEDSYRPIVNATIATDIADDIISIDSQQPIKWLTCIVIDRQTTSLRMIDKLTAYLPASFFTRYIDMTTHTHTGHDC